MNQLQPHQFSEPRWFYCGPDNIEYGPYTNREMLVWFKEGYFKESLPIKTEMDDRYRPLGEWQMVCGGNLPFALSFPIHSFDSFVALSQAAAARAAAHHAAPPAAPILMMPPGLPPSYPPPSRFTGPPPFLPPPMQQQNHVLAPVLISQPPSEPHDGSSLSHTPDSEHEYRLGNGVPVSSALHGNQHPTHHNHMVSHSLRYRDSTSSTCDAPWLNGRSVDTQTSVQQREASCQTVPVIISSKRAAEVLSELVGQKISIQA